MCMCGFVCVLKGRMFYKIIFVKRKIKFDRANKNFVRVFFVGSSFI